MQNKSSLLNKNIAFILILIFGNANALCKEKLDVNSINFYEINRYAGLANIAYQSTKNIKKKLFRENYRLTRLNTINGIEVSYYIITNDITKTQIIAIRGTSNIENAIANFSLKLTFDKQIGAYLHNGFLLAAQTIYKEIIPYIKRGYTVNTTGHSLGGAIALILAMNLDSANVPIGKVITFAQPKVSNITGAYKYQHLNVIRIVLPKDLIPLVPIIDPLDIDDLDIYWHQGKEVLLLPGLKYAILEGITSMLRVIKFTQDPLNEHNFKHHKISHYLLMLNKKIPVAKLVPFKSSFNLFNLF